MINILYEIQDNQRATATKGVMIMPSSQLRLLVRQAFNRASQEAKPNQNVRIQAVMNCIERQHSVVDNLLLSTILEIVDRHVASIDIDGNLNHVTQYLQLTFSILVENASKEHKEVIRL